MHSDVILLKQRCLKFAVSTNYNCFQTE